MPITESFKYCNECGYDNSGGIYPPTNCRRCGNPLSQSYFARAVKTIAREEDACPKCGGPVDYVGNVCRACWFNARISIVAMPESEPSRIRRFWEENSLALTLIIFALLVFFGYLGISALIWSK